MLRGLVIRRVFVIVDVLLAGCVLLVASLVVVNVLGKPENPFGETEVRVASLNDLSSVLHDVGARAQYDGILTSRIFGPAGDETSKSQEVPPGDLEPAEEDIEETKLNLALRGTVATSPRDRLASATIENKDTRQIQVYGLGHEIIEQVVLEEVYPREVIISNKGKREILRMDDEESLASARTASSSSSSRPSPPQAPERITLNTDEFVQELYVNYADLVSKVKPEMYRDENGKVVGITASNIEEIPLAKTLQLRDGDVLQTINSEQIDSEEKIIQLINKNRDTKTFRIGILRNGRPLIRTYHLD